ILSFIISYSLISFGDKYIVNYFGLEVSLMWISFRQLFTLFAMNILVAILSSWIPIYRFAKQKPIDTIKLV
ncbi:MAG: hypothetical protein CVV63_03745, partial [Tenericutes bacterium HGW-Tenericutes-8]